MPFGLAAWEARGQFLGEGAGVSVLLREGGVVSRDEGKGEVGKFLERGECSTRERGEEVGKEKREREKGGWEIGMECALPSLFLRGAIQLGQA